ncbi:hypothetical protein C1H76_1382 [Elsinoe australis]|uniref:Topoisomerase 1-associated factor 1 n=1 Tax=Elsinoe australis TaxID=40998 RepID=A0A4U7B9V7_9PEZI|nr:hypothetical protein C1H76_1382 [Elsinoe australis]
MEVFEKSQTIDPEVRAYVYSLVSAIGGASAADDGRYVLGDDALACLKDLRRWLKLYDTKLDRFDVKRVLSEANLVKGDLLEILGQWKEDDETNVLRRKVAVGSLELLTELTWPLVLDGEKATVNHVRHLPVIQLAQVEYKRAILHHESESILHKAIAAAVPAMTTPRKERSAREEGIINLMLFLFRNVIMISQPPNLPSSGNEEDVSRSETIHALQQQDVLQLILTICSGMGEDFDGQDVIILELLFHLLKGIDPKQIFQNDRQVVNDKMADFKKALQAEKSMLSAQARNAPTRHNRFGTMIWVKQSDDKISTLTGQDTIMNGDGTLRKMDSTKQWNRPKHAKRDSQEGSSDFAPVSLDSRSRAALKTFISDFLDSSFNPLFLHLRRALEREPDRVKPDHARQFFFLIAWFLRAFTARQTHCPPPQSQDATVETPYAYIAAVLTQETFVLLNRTMQKNLDDKSYADVHTCLLAFTQIMLTVSAMSESRNEDDQEIAENMQARLFYEEQTHDRILAVLRGYQEGRQGLPYLEACTELAHVFIRLLERYSKVNVDMFVRSKRRARKKAKAKPKGGATVEGLEEDVQTVPDDGADDEVEAHKEVQERKFDFSRFAARFVNEASVDTYVALLRRYRDLDEEQLKRCHRFFYRVAFKMERVILLFRVDILELFQRLIKGPNGLDTKVDRKSAVFKEWEELVKQIFRRCIKKVDERPQLVVEMLFSKIPNTLFFLEYGYEKEVIKAAPRAPAEMEIKPGMDHLAEIGVAVGALINQGKLDALAWVKTVLNNAVDERRSWEDLNVALQEKTADSVKASPLFGDGEQKTGETQEATESVETTSKPEEAPQAPAIVVMPDSEERRTATFKDKHLRLLLKTLALQRLGANDDPTANWIIPSSLTATQLEDDLDAIRKFEFDPPVYENGKSAESFIRSEAAGRRNAYEKEASDDEGDSDLDESLFVPGGPTVRPDDPRPEKPKRKKLRRRGEEITEEERQARAEARKKKEKEKDAKVKSTLFVTESDDEDDDERDAEFFKREKERRGKAADAVKAALMDGRTGHGEEGASKKRKSVGESKPVKKRKTAMFEEESDDDEDVVDAENVEPMVISSRESTPADESDEESEEASDDETPLSSQTGLKDVDVTMEEVPAAKTAEVLRPTSGNEQRQRVDSDDEDEVVPIKSSRRSNRPVFVVDDDSD